MGTFMHPRGSHLIGPHGIVRDWLDERNSDPHLAIQSRSRNRAIQRPAGREVESMGINFGSQDYLGVSSHPLFIWLVLDALREYGPTHASSPILQGNTLSSLKLEESLGEFLPN
jgi:glycine C-acetyltransferase